MSEDALKARKENAQLSTGPKTPEGKAVSSMNGLKTGQYATKFWKLPPESCGNLVVCKSCGDIQQAACRESGQCLMHNEITLAYVKTHDTGDTKHIENLNVLQLATMDLLFSQKLRYAQIHLGEIEEYVDQDGHKHNKEIIDTQYIYMLMNMLKNLNKSMTDMQLTKQTQDNIDVAWAELAKSEISPEKAATTKQQILNEMKKWRQIQGQADAMEELDEAIKQHRNLDEAANENAENIDFVNIGTGPFRNGK